jgi:hypothetical protein
MLQMRGAIELESEERGVGAAVRTLDAAVVVSGDVEVT